MAFQRSISVMLLTLAPIALAQTVPEIEGFAKRNWQRLDGLPDKNVLTLRQTPDHYLWIGTKGGLVRFDGDQFTVFDQDEAPPALRRSVYALCPASDGSLWIGTAGGGLVRFRHGSFRTYTASDGLTNRWVRTISEDRQHRLWVGTDQGLFELRDERLQRVEAGLRDPSLRVQSILEDRSGRLWVIGSNLVSLLNGKPANHVADPPVIGTVNAIREMRDGTILLGDSAGAMRVDRLRPDGLLQVTRLPHVSGIVRAIEESSDGSAWIGTIGGGVFRLQGGLWSKASAPSTLPSNTVFAVLEDEERNVWLGTHSGLVRLSPAPVRAYLLDPAADVEFGTVTSDGDGVWYASERVYRLTGARLRDHRFAGPLAHLPVRNVFRSRDGALWIGTNGNGLYRQARGTDVPALVPGTEGLFIRALAEAGDGAMWIGTSTGLVRWTQRGLTLFNTINSRLCYDSIRAVLPTRDGDIWIGTERGVSRLRGGEFQEDAVVARLRPEMVWAIHHDPAGGLWFGTVSNGLFRYKEGTVSHFTKADGLVSDAIYGILEDRAGKFWMSGPDGIFSVLRKDLESVAAGAVRRLAITLYGPADGLENSRMHEGSQPAGCIDRNGAIWFAADRGPVRIDPAPQTGTRSPTAVVDRVVADGHRVSPEQAIRLTPGAGGLEIGYSAIRLRSQEGVRFRYRLEGFDEQWVDAGRRREAFYTRVPAGNYRFRVQAFDISQPEQTSEAAVAIDWQPHVYERRPFLVLCGVMVVLAIWGAHRYRVRQERQRVAAVMEERNRVAREMHDTLIQGCAGVSALLEASSAMEQSGQQSGRDLIDYARFQIRSVIEDARRVVWNLRNGAPADGKLAPMLSELARARGAQSGIPITFELEGQASDLAPHAGYELLRVAEEAVSNAIRHAQANRIELRLKFDDDHVQLVVEDDGCGFDERATGAPQGHFGLVGIRERSERAGGTFDLRTSPGRGTSIRVTVPHPGVRAPLPNFVP